MVNKRINLDRLAWIVGELVHGGYKAAEVREAALKATWFDPRRNDDHPAAVSSATDAFEVWLDEGVVHVYFRDDKFLGGYEV